MRKLDQVQRLLEEVRCEVLSGQAVLTREDADRLNDMADRLRAIRNDLIRQSPLSPRELALQFNLSEARVSQIRNFWQPH